MVKQVRGQGVFVTPIFSHTGMATLTHQISTLTYFHLAASVVEMFIYRFEKKKIHFAL